MQINFKTHSCKALYYLLSLAILLFLGGCNEPTDVHNLSEEDATKELLRQGKLIQEGSIVDPQSHKGTDLLKSAIENHDKNTIELLLAAGADVNDCGTDGIPLLMQFIRDGNPDGVKLLIKKGANVNIEGKILSVYSDMTHDWLEVTTPLTYAFAKEDIKCIKLLLKGGADVNGRSEHCYATPLAIACWKGNIKGVKSLLKMGADVNAGFGIHHPGACTLILPTNALNIACMEGNSEIVKLLLDAGANANATESVDQTTALIIACKYGNIQCIKLLLEVGADVNTGNGKPLRSASTRGDAEAVKMLIDAGATATDPILEEACQQGVFRVSDRVTIHLRHNYVTKYDEVVKLLLKAGAKPTDDALLFACRAGNADVVEILLDAGANPWASSSRSGLYGLTTENCSDEACRKLIEAAKRRKSH